MLVNKIIVYTAGRREDASHKQARVIKMQSTGALDCICVSAVLSFVIENYGYTPYFVHWSIITIQY